jgi:hypothetical protein
VTCREPHSLPTLRSPLLRRSGSRAVALAGIAGIALLAGAGCVVPLAPEFENDDNEPPYLISAMPPVGTLSVMNPSFTVTVQDPNPTDTLQVRWLIDYPPYDKNTKQFTGEIPNRNPAIIDFKPDCILHNISNNMNPHRLMVVVSDRPFLPTATAPPDRPYDVTEEGSHPLRAVWLFRMDCPNQ